MTPKQRADRLAELIRDGLTFPECVIAFADADSDPYVIAARTNQMGGVIEIDSPTVVSRGDDPGAYVMAWIWIDNADAGLPHDISSEAMESEEPHGSAATPA